MLTRMNRNLFAEDCSPQVFWTFPTYLSTLLIHGSNPVYPIKCSLTVISTPWVQ